MASKAWHDSMLSPERDCGPGRPPRKRYAILSTPRCGSTLLCRALEATGQLGVPHEYLNPNTIAAHERAGGGRPPLWDYLAHIETRRSSASGWFGIKTHYRQFVQHFADRALDEAKAFLRRQTRLILIWRADSAAQAVSYYLARASGRWTSEHDAYLPPDYREDVRFDPEMLCDCLAEVREGASSWLTLLDQTGLDYLPVQYENLVADYPRQMRRVLDWLGVQASVPPAPTQPSPISTERTLLHKAFLRWLSTATNHLD